MWQESVLKLADELELPAPVKKLIEEQLRDFPWEACSELICQLTDPVLAEEAQEHLAKRLKPREGNTGMAQLAAMLSAVCLTREKYRESNLTDSVFYDTMGCFSRFLYETRRNTGEWLFDRAFWTWRQTAGRLFRLGTLEFEYCRAKEALPEAEFQRGDMVLHVHIPSDARLTEEDLADSYRTMNLFFTEHAKAICPLGKPKAVLCDSWLLSPELFRLLGPTSGIRRFASEYEVFKTDFGEEDCFLWLFHGVKDLQRLPEDTSLQRAVKEYMLKGGKIGSGIGVLTKQIFNGA